MAFDFLTTVNLLQVVQGLDRPASFLRDRYFPTNAATDIFSTNKVLAEYRDGSKKLAPFVAPRVGGVTMTRKGFEMVEYEPPKVAPRRVMTLDDLDRRGFGEDHQGSSHAIWKSCRMRFLAVRKLWRPRLCRQTAL